MKYYFIIALFLLYGNTSSAQDNTQINDNSFFDISFFQVGANYLNMDFQNVNDRLSELGLPNSFKNGVFVPTVGINLVGNRISEKIYAKILVGYTSKENERSSIENESSILNTRFDIGYNFYKINNHYFNATLGFGWTNLKMNFTDLSNRTDNFDDAVFSFASREIFNDNLYFLNLGAGYTYLFDDFYLNVDAGYKISLNSGEWETRSTKLNNAPSISPSGFYVGVYIGIQNF